MADHRIAQVTIGHVHVEVDETVVATKTRRVAKEFGRAVIVEEVATIFFHYGLPTLFTFAAFFFGAENLTLPYPSENMTAANKQSVVEYVTNPTPTMRPAQIVVPVYTVTPTR